jgi:hypothetical protein
MMSEGVLAALLHGWVLTIHNCNSVDSSCSWSHHWHTSCSSRLAMHNILMHLTRAETTPAAEWCCALASKETLQVRTPQAAAQCAYLPSTQLTTCQTACTDS